ncbi:MAG: carboxypeptidase-like regulatory domain-containing protein, partial [Blastocatellia bacterium]|nr:carboxypeptidase-like regulatory domain-containing protein [Blastocatellia bacterium]
MKRDAKKTWTTMITVLAMVVTLCLPAASPAQESTGSIEGAVTDPSGAVVAGATVTITSKKTARTITVTTTGAGVYVARALQPGEYEVKIEATGFKTGVRQVTVQVGAASIGDVSLEVGSPT